MSDVETDIDPEESQISIPQDEANDVIGFSISRAQSHMKSVQTPLTEKQAAMLEETDYITAGLGLRLTDATETGSGWPGVTATDVKDRAEISTSTLRLDKRDDDMVASPKTSPTTNIPSLPAASPESDGMTPKPSPWRAEKVQPAQRTDASRSILKEGLMVRRRASSGGLLDVNFKKYLPSLPNWSMPKTPTLSSFGFGSSSASGERTSPGTQNRAKRSSTLFSRTGSPYIDTDQRGRSSSRSHLAYSGLVSVDGSSQQREPSRVGELRPEALYRGPSALSLHSTRSTIRRSASESSIFARKSLSRASTLDDISKWDHIQGQVNSRFQAIKDTLQDSSFKMPNLSSLKLDSFRPDFAYGRTNSDVAQRNRILNAGSANQGAKGLYLPDSSRNTTAAQASHSPTQASHTKHPVLSSALSRLSGDVVVMGGYRGSVLRSAKPPHQMMWIPVIKAGLNIRKVDLEVGLRPEDEENMEQSIYPDGVLSHIGPVDICRRLLKKLRKREKLKNGELRVHDYGYDWRLSPHLLSRRLIKYLEKLPCNQPGVPKDKRGATVVAHSLGGLITRHAVNQRPELFAGVVYAGTPQHCVNILGPLRNGDSVLLSQRVLTAQVNFTFRTSFVLLPEDGHCFINKETLEEYRVDFFDPKTWEEYRLSPCIQRALPALPSQNQDTSRGLMETLSETISSSRTRKASTATAGSPSQPATNPHNKHAAADSMGDAAIEPFTMSTNSNGTAQTNSISTTVTIPKDQAVKYLTRTLAETKAFKHELHFRKAHADANVYPPLAVIYSKNTPTVWGAKVESRDSIQRVDVYDDLAFSAGDGVCLAKAAMLPDGYRCVKGGLVKSERGHVGLLGDLEGVGQALLAVMAGRERGVGLGTELR